jgi:hypothetical protein
VTPEQRRQSRRLRSLNKAITLAAVFRSWWKSVLTGPNDRRCTGHFILQAGIDRRLYKGSLHP